MKYAKELDEKDQCDLESQQSTSQFFESDIFDLDEALKKK